MTEKRLFIGKKTVKDRFTIITDYDDEIGVKENWSGDVIVIKHDDLGTQQFVAQLVQFLNDQNQAIVDLYDGSKYWSDKATEMIKELQDENEKLKQDKQHLHQSMSRQEVRHKQFKDKVFDLIDKKIEKYSLKYKLYNTNAIEVLKELKKELEE